MYCLTQGKSSRKMTSVFRRVSHPVEGSDCVDGLGRTEDKRAGKPCGRSLRGLCRVEEESVHLPEPVTIICYVSERTV